MHQKDLPLLELIQLFFGVGKIFKLGKDSIQYRATSHKDLAIIVEHFDKYPLISQKRADCELFKQAFNLISHKEHLTTEGLQKLVAIKASMNNGLSDELKAAFPNISPVTRPLVQNQEIIDPDWVVGFVDAEGCFFVNHYKSSTHKLGFGVQCVFYITQHIRDAELINSFNNYFGCGRYRPGNGQGGNFIVTDFTDITGKIIPFFKKYPLHSVKNLNFLDFCRVVEIVRAKAHLTPEGLEKIRRIKEGMNSGRVDV